MALRRLTVHLEPHIDDWLRQIAAKNGRSINQELNEALQTLKRGLENRQKRQEIAAMQAKIAAIKNQKAAQKSGSDQPK